MKYGYGVKAGNYHLNTKMVFTDLRLPLARGDWAQFDTPEKAREAGKKYAPSRWIQDNLETVKLV